MSPWKRCSHARYYDGAGNPTTLRGQSGFTFDADNQLTGGPAGLGAFAYDGNGNPTTYRGSTLAFDSNDKLTGIGTGANAGDGLRVWKQTAAGARTYFLYDGSTPVAELDASGNVTATNTFGPTGLLSRRNTVSGASTFYFFDERGNTVQRFDASRLKLSNHMYDAFGATVQNPSSDTQAPDASDPFDGMGEQFGYYMGQETGLVLCTNRYYDPGTARWLTRDPIGYEGGINLYGYVQGNPVMGVDPSGLTTLIVYGSDQGPNVRPYEFAFEMASWFIPGETSVTLYQPTKSDLLDTLELPQIDAFYFWGHGSGRVMFLANDTPEGTITSSDIARVTAFRARRHMPKLKWVEIHACDSASSARKVNTWLSLTRSFGGYVGLTGSFTPFPHVNFMTTYKSPISYDPSKPYGSDPKAAKK